MLFKITNGIFRQTQKKFALKMPPNMPKDLKDWKQEPLTERILKNHTTPLKK